MSKAFMYEVAQYKTTSVTCMITPGVKSCSQPLSMRPISRLTDCQVGWLWTVETAVKIAPLPPTLCSLQETNFCGCATEIVSFFVVLVCPAAVFALCEFSSLFTSPTDSGVRNLLCDQFMEFTESAVGGRHMVRQCGRVCCGKGRLHYIHTLKTSVH